MALPLRETTDVSIKGGVFHIIDEVYHQQASQYSTQLAPIDELRSKVKANVVNMNSIIILKRYYNYIVQLQTHLPKGIEFEWFNCFNSKVAVKCESFRFEKIMTLYQISAMYTQLALKENELKTKGVYFQYASGCLEVIVDDLKTNGDFGETDLTLSAARSLYYLTLAEAQEIFWLKAKNDDIRETVLIKLGKQVSTLYEKSFEFSHISEQFSQDWCNYLEVKALHFESASLFRYSRYMQSKERYGDEISYLRQAQSVLSNLPKVCISKEAVSDSESLQLEISKRLSVAERENSLIHMQEIPNFEDFKAIPGAELAKPVVPREIMTDYIDPTLTLKLLDSLVPISVIDQCTSFQASLREYVQSEMYEPITCLIKGIDTFCSDSQVNSQLDSITPQNVPVTITQYRDRIMEHGFVDKIINEMNKLNGLRVKCKNELDTIMAEVEKRLPAAGDDMDFKQLYKNFKVFQQYITEGERGDLVINKQIEDLKPFLDAYQTSDTLSAFIPSPDIEHLNPDLILCIGKLRGILTEFDELKEQCLNLRSSTEQNLNKVNNELLKDVTAEYRKSKLVPSSDILTKYRDKLQHQFSELEDIKAKESNIKLDFNSIFQRFLHLKSNLVVSEERQSALAVLTSTYSGYFEILDNLSQGFEFYLNLEGRIREEDETFKRYFIKLN